MDKNTLNKLINMRGYQVEKVLKFTVELMNCKQRFILLKKNKLTKNQSQLLEQLCKLNEPIYKAMLLKEQFLQLYSMGDALLGDRSN